MMHIRSIALLLCVAFVAAAPSRAAETKSPPKTPEERLQDAATHFRDWIESLFNHIDDIVAKEDRRRLAHDLEPLESSLFRFEMEKREVIEVLTAPAYDDGRIGACQQV